MLQLSVLLALLSRGLDEAGHAVPLVHDAGLAVTVRIDLGVHLLAHAGVGVGAVDVSGAMVESGRTHLTVAAAKSAADGARLTLEAVVALLAPSEDTPLLLEVTHADSWEGRGGVMLSGVVVDLVNGHGRVDNVRLNGLCGRVSGLADISDETEELTLVNDRLDGLMNVVVDVLASDDWSHRAGVLTLNPLRLIAVLALLSCELALDLVAVIVLVRAVLNGDNVVVVLLRHARLILHWLDRGVVVILVNLLVNGRLHVLVLSAVDSLVGDCWCDLLVDGGVMVTSLRPNRPVSGCVATSRQ